MDVCVDTMSPTAAGVRAGASSGDSLLAEHLGDLVLQGGVFGSEPADLAQGGFEPPFE